jgi:hypothetical protein
MTPGGVVIDRAAGAFQVHRDRRDFDAVVRRAGVDHADVLAGVSGLPAGLRHALAGLRHLPAEVPDLAVEPGHLPAGAPNLPGQLCDLPVGLWNLAAEVRYVLCADALVVPWLRSGSKERCGPGWPAALLGAPVRR